MAITRYVWKLPKLEPTLNKIGCTVSILVVTYNKLRILRKTNPVRPNNKYLEAIYHCVKGHIFENPVQNRLRCSNGHWVGVKPTCVPKTTPMTVSSTNALILT